MKRHLRHLLFPLGLGLLAFSIIEIRPVTTTNVESTQPAASVVETEATRKLASLPEASATMDPIERFKRKYQRPEEIPFPSWNPYSEDKYELGKMLFFDPRLSRSETMSCATCHNPSFDWGNGLPRAVGHGHEELGRRAPTILNLAWGLHFFWDGRAETLEEQALGPIQAEKEMNMDLETLVEKLSQIPEYVIRFSLAFPNASISGDTIAKAIATFERTVVSGLAPFDQWIAGDELAINESAKRGFALFNMKGKCVKCHTGWKFTNDSFADIGLKTDDLGRGKLMGDHDSDFAFKTPTLRNIANRGPFMHDGSLSTLEEVVENYSIGGTVKRKTAQQFIQPVNFTAQEKKDVIAFLMTLTSEDELVTPPKLPVGQIKKARQGKQP